jgi:alpha-ketoglutarate-dependent taurine dioxygenase
MSIVETEITETEITEADQTGFVTSEFLAPGATLPLIFRPATAKVSLAEMTQWLRTNRDFIERQLVKYGALLFRDFPLNTADDFEQFALAISDKLLEYRERSSPRSQVGENVYTSTDYPPSQKIFPHNEHSYAVSFPLKLFFFCETPAKRGGETPLADTRKILRRINPEVRDRFKQKKWMYMRNFGHGLGVPWRTAFQTLDRSVVEDYAVHSKIELEWKDGDCLRTRQVRPAFATHPHTGELLWFNHATFFHVSTLEAGMREVLMEEFAEEDLPNNTYYGDGSAIEPWVLDHLREAYMNETVSFTWHKGDVIILDNMLTAHSRLSFVGPRKVLFAMAEPITREV